MSPIQAVVFDIGNVLIEWQPERFFDGVIGAERRRAMFAAIDLHSMNDRSDMGENFHDLMAETIATYPDWEAELAIWRDRWIDMASPAIDHSARLLRALKAQDVPVFALSNFGIQTFDMAKPVYPVLSEFDRSYISGHMGVIKPDPVIYQMVEEDCGIAPEGLLFADDRLDNIAAARKRGWQTHVFTTPDGFAKRLVDEGLLTAEAAA